MIEYTEKGFGLHEAIAIAGHSLARVDGVWVASDKAAVQAIIDAYQSKDVTTPDLTGPQFEFFLVMSGLADVWDAAQDAVRKVNIERYAVLRAMRKRDSFHFKTTGAVFKTFAPFLPDGVTLDAETLRPLWLQAAAADI